MTQKQVCTSDQTLNILYIFNCITKCLQLINPVFIGLNVNGNIKMSKYGLLRPKSHSEHIHKKTKFIRNIYKVKFICIQIHKNRTKEFMDGRNYNSIRP